MSEQNNRHYFQARIGQYTLTSEEWLEENPVLLNGEIGIEADTNLIKIGDGVTDWSHLTYQYGIDTNYIAGLGIIINNRNISTNLQYDVI